ncbi:LysR family transcriptional regulator [Chelatococcus composti]|jgi:Transcriptional regulator|uniref:DNA-binding transcriptional LysR family regulator n=1 Tax=Chelatococcus composti TaxID=1743235 RepID=A0A841KBX8_9HYPH|nr:LysR family transcriptional regulator [Chelatococcus composti]MBB6169795.1 DNA-binding transcriptional LysR family regulator [Chelatococcus composti]MBS7736234.1 LysR family transcriptional regulator [Chelatococcus composti]GGG49776.1 LysR family transcriptional regulator [Chelatococcus composti]
MNSSDLAFFLAAARHGGIGRAAVALNTVQSNVTARIQALEAEIGQALFTRHSRGVRLTPAGERLMPYALRIAQLLAEAREAVRDDRANPSGLLRIGSLETTAALRLPPVLAAFARACPRVDLHVETGTSEDLIRKVLDGDLAAAFVVGPVAHAALVAEPMVEEELVLVTAPWQGPPRWLSSTPDAPALEGNKLIVFRSGCSYRRRFEALVAAAGVAETRYLEFGTLDGIIGCVAAGIGISLLPRAVVEPARAAGRIAIHALPPDSARAVTVLVRRRDAHVSAALARLADCARGAMSPAGRDAA